jgi:hypothetical protein
MEPEQVGHSPSQRIGLLTPLGKEAAAVLDDFRAPVDIYDVAIVDALADVLAPFVYALVYVAEN